MDEKQLAAQISHWQTVAKNSGGDSASKELARLKVSDYKNQQAWQTELSKTPVGSPERAVLMQKGRDYEWIKDAPNDTTTAVKSTNTMDGTETTVTTKGVAKPAQTMSNVPADGTILRKNGQTYIVKNGIPVLEKK